MKLKREQKNKYKSFGFTGFSTRDSFRCTNFRVLKKISFR